jgi:hypothetical protein
MRGDATRPEKRTAQAVTRGVDLFSMTDEEQDIGTFQEYLRTLSPESLWDVQRHLDADRYPRRTEATSREIARRHLIYLTPYSPLERKLRLLFGCLLLLSALAAALHGVAGIPIPLLPGEKLPYFYDLAAGGPKAARMVLPLTVFLASAFFAASAAGVLIGIFHLAHRRLRAEVFATGIASLLLGFLFLLIAYR